MTVFIIIIIISYNFIQENDALLLSNMDMLVTVYSYISAHAPLQTQGLQ